MLNGIALFNLILPEEHYFRGTLVDLTEKLSEQQWPHIAVLLENDMVSVYKGSNTGIQKKFELKDGKWMPQMPPEVLLGYIEIAKLYLEN